ncbi:molybdate ABC transporter substrate-binding protein [Devosia sp.]|uniref:molybdate ABC transporter substrate-binding protein n=1 Tax=Devosia sp. TaxID=1871048 RepID=UPI003A9114FB
MNAWIYRALILLTLLAGGGSVHAGEVSVAVAANFIAPAQEIADAFSAQSGDDVILSSGATGGLFAQISQGAPYEVFLAADAARPQLAIDQGLAVAGSAFTYAVGRLALYDPAMRDGDGMAWLSAVGFAHLAIADPVSAPYGTAAFQALERLGLLEAVRPRLVTGQNISQALQFVESGSAELGMVALGQVLDRAEGSVWQVPETLYDLIRQDAVLLTVGADNPVASAFLAYLAGPEARAIIVSHGYAEVASGE